ncbi:Bug family tripartite tricarboxylate transporter substrate binding protein [Janibacter melonis]|nr:tripartite tricarboxylate transporter substrate-binding protein [Janibacter melonis]MBD5830553.1 tripartite tricarboxylate transporter substrate binding protein [Janibacter melonis]
MPGQIARRSLLLAGLTAPLAACGVTRREEGGPERLRMMIPNKPGGGYDETGRAAVKTLEDADLTARFEVFNVTGASGTVAMAQLINNAEATDLMMTMGLGVVGAVRTNKSDATVGRATPIAQLIEDAEAIYVPADSPFATIDDLVTAWTKDPGKVSVGGGSSPGGPDHLFPMQLAQALDIPARQVSYTPYDGGGDMLPALLGGKVDIAASGATEFDKEVEEGQLRVLAVSGAKAVEGLDAPTLKQSDIDLEFTNWRGIIGPPGLPADRQAEFIELLTTMHDEPAWGEVLKLRQWTDRFVTGDDFGTFLQEQDTRVETTLKELGLV